MRFPLGKSPQDGFLADSHLPLESNQKINEATDENVSGSPQVYEYGETVPHPPARPSRELGGGGLVLRGRGGGGGGGGADRGPQLFGVRGPEDWYNFRRICHHSLTSSARRRKPSPWWAGIKRPVMWTLKATVCLPCRQGTSGAKCRRPTLLNCILLAFRAGY